MTTHDHHRIRNIDMEVSVIMTWCKGVVRYIVKINMIYE